MLSKISEKLLLSLHDFLQRIEKKAKAIQLQKRTREFQSYGKDVFIHHSCTLVNCRNISMSNNIHIGSDCYLMAQGGLQIRDNVHISRNVTIYCSDHDFRSGERIPYSEKRVWKPVTICEDAWIGMHACILPGVRIGKGAIVGMGAVISKDVPDYAIVGRGPQRIIGERSSEDYERLRSANQIGGRNGKKLSDGDLGSYLKTGRAKKPKITFVVTTGRSGSTTLANWLSKHPRIDATHEPRPQMIKWSTEYAHGTYSSEKTLELLSDLFLDGSVYKEGILRLESDQKYFNLIPFLHKIFPEAKFIWVVRNAKDVVSSTVGRGWYSGQPQTFQTEKNPWFYEAFRITGLADGIEAEAWKAMSAFEKNCWYWAYVNRTIESDWEQLPDKQKLLVKLESVEAQSPEILSFLGVQPLKTKVPIANRARHGRLSSDKWSEEQWAVYNKWCKPLMERIYLTK